MDKQLPIRSHIRYPPPPPPPTSNPTNLVPKNLVHGSDDATRSSPGESSPFVKRNIVSPSSDDLNVLFSNVNKCDPKATILRLFPDYFKQFTGNKK